MASSSSQSPKKYEVFISFRGEDIRFSFISHLLDALCRNKIETFIDYRLEKGDEVWPSLEKAIEDSTLFLVVFSENYASSTWCLKELTKILDCSKNEVVMPVFYRVDPSRVRKQSRSYQKAFEEHELKGINKQQLQWWREALTHAANLSGWHCSHKSDEAALIKEIVERVIQKLSYNNKYQSEDYLKGKIGIHNRMAEVESLLYKDPNDVRVVGIWAMGGMGKTTLAKALFDKLCFDYEGFCFLSDVREKSKKYGIDVLWKKLILTLLGDKESHIDISDAISPYIKRRLGRKKSFIVLDDVDDHEQLENLVGKHDWFGHGSKILLTARDKQVFGDKVDYIYKLEALNSDEAFRLFSLNAFKEYSCDPKLESLARNFTSYADGNPLALKVLGSLLYGKNQEVWESQLEKLEKLLCPKINDILKLSFEGLDGEEKNIFLDIACFFNDSYVEDVKNLLDACGYSTIVGLESLKDKALLHTYGNQISMHNMIKEMGRQIVREESLDDPKRRSRLWNSKEISDILKKNMGSEDIRGITLNMSEVEEMCLNAQTFRSMTNLKFLDFHKTLNDRSENKLKFPCGMEFLPDELRLLCWVEYPLKSLPTKFKAENLVKFHMCDSNLTKLWDGVQNLVNLRSIRLSRSKELIELPDFSKAKHLESIDLGYCSKLRNVHASILSLNSLSSLTLFDCKSLTRLTSNTHLKSLSYLGLQGCSRLNEFSVTSENCKFQLHLTGTAINDNLCSSSGRLSRIHTLFLSNCKSLTSLPYKLADLSNLRRLFACGSKKLALNLCKIFDEVRALEVLELRNCSELFELPDNISLLSSLRELDLSGSNLETLPLSIKHLSSLKRLRLYDCKRLRFLPDLPPSIIMLDLQNCLSLESLHLPLMNEGKVAYDVFETRLHFNFRNCMKLDRQVIKAAEAKVAPEINKAIYKKALIEYPGKRVPKWCMYRTRECFITLDLSSIPQPWDGSSIFCVVVSKTPPITSILANCFIDGQYALEAGTTHLTTEDLMLSDHVFLWYDLDFSGQLERKIEEKKADAQSKTYLPSIQIQFRVTSFELSHHGRVGKIKECGVCPISSHEYQNYIKQIQSALHAPHPNSNAMGLACFYDDDDDDEEDDDDEAVCDDDDDDDDEIPQKAYSRKRKYNSD